MSLCVKDDNTLSINSYKLCLIEYCSCWSNGRVWACCTCLTWKNSLLAILITHTPALKLSTVTVTVNDFDAPCYDCDVVSIYALDADGNQLPAWVLFRLHALHSASSSSSFAPTDFRGIPRHAPLLSAYTVRPVELLPIHCLDLGAYDRRGTFCLHMAIKVHLHLGLSIFSSVHPSTRHVQQGEVSVGAMSAQTLR